MEADRSMPVTRYPSAAIRAATVPVPHETSSTLAARPGAVERVTSVVTSSSSRSYGGKPDTTAS